MTPDPVHAEAARYGGWSWHDPAHGEHFRRCSYCGSINPGELAAETAWKAEWADAKYGWPHKFYVDLINRDADQLFVISSTTAKDGPGGFGGSFDWHRWEDLTPELAAVAERDGETEASHSAWLGFGRRPTHFAKFYSVHLADPTLDPTVKDAIEVRSGLRFAFADGRVTWSAVNIA